MLLASSNGESYATIPWKVSFIFEERISHFLPYLFGYVLADIRPDFGMPALGLRVITGHAEVRPGLPGLLFSWIASDGIQPKNTNPKTQSAMPVSRVHVFAVRRAAARSIAPPATAPEDSTRTIFRPNRIRVTITRVI